MALLRREFIAGVTASLPVAAGLGATSSAAAEFSLNDLASPSEMWAELLHVNDEFGPTRLCGQPHHKQYVAYLRRQLTDILAPVGGQVFEDTFDNYPNWAATSWSLSADGRDIPVASYFPYSNGGFTGARSPLVPAAALAAPGGGGGYPRADGVNVKIIPPTTSAAAPVVNLGTFAGPGSINWADASGKLAYIDYPVALGSSRVTPAIYNVNEIYDSGQVNQEAFSIPANPTYSIQIPPDISNATQAGVLGVILGWVGLSDGNAAGQYCPFQVARYFARLPQSQRPRSIAFMVATGHFSHGYLGSSGDWIVQHPQIINSTVASLTIEHFGCNEWEDVTTDSGLQYAPTGKLEQARCYVTQPSFQLDQPGPADPALLSIVEQSLAGLLDRVAVVSGGAFSGEGGPFHHAKIPAIGYIPVPQYLVAIADDGEISKLDPEHFYDQVEFTIKCLLAMQDVSADMLAG